MLDKCAAPGCKSPRTKDSDYCLSHEIAPYLDIQIYPAPVTPPSIVLWGILAGITPEKEESHD